MQLQQPPQQVNVVPSVPVVPHQVTHPGPSQHYTHPLDITSPRYLEHSPSMIHQPGSFERESSDDEMRSEQVSTYWRVDIIVMFITVMSRVTLINPCILSIDGMQRYKEPDKRDVSYASVTFATGVV